MIAHQPIRSPHVTYFVALATAGYAVVAGAIALLGWVLELPRLTDWNDQGISMFANTALCAVLSGATLFLLVAIPRSTTVFVSRVLSSAVALIAGLTLCEHVTGVNLGIDTLLVNRPWGQNAATAPMRMGVPASTSFVVLAIAFMLATLRGRARVAATICAMVTFAIASLSLTGYWFGADQLFGIARFTGIALQTSTVIAALSVGVLAAIPEHGIVAALQRDDAGGALHRRLLVPVLVIPLLLGWVRILGQNMGLYDTEFGTALRSLVEVVLFFALLWWTASNVRQQANSTQQAQARLAAIVESSNDAVISKSLDGVIESWNVGAERTFGYSSAEAIGRHISLIIPSDRIGEEAEIIDQLRRGQCIEHFETVRLRKDGIKISVSLTVSPIKNSAGQTVGASKIARDISERRRAEDRLRALVEATPECIQIVAPDGALEYMNQAGLGMIETDSESAVLGSCVYELIAAEHRQEWISRHQRVCAGERLSWEFEIVGLQGTRRWLETHAVPLPLPDGRLAQLGVTREVTSRKQLEREREHLLVSERTARSVAERASHLKDEFLATLSHELRTPLNAILGWAQLLSPLSDRADLEQGLETIERNARVQAQLIEELLDMSRIISGKVRLNAQPIDLTVVVQAAIESVALAASAKGIHISRALDAHAGTVLGDPARLQQVLWNLLNNAIKFTPQAGSVRVTLERAHAHLQISVHDTGMGIAPEFLPIVFERFRQVDSSITRSHGGLGIGLSIAKHLVELHGGTIEVTSEGIGQGATFTFTLPLETPSRDDKAHAPTAVPPAVFEWELLALCGIKVLIVDDEPDARALIERVLTQCGAVASAATSAADGLEQLRSFRPHVIVSDIGMPIADGYQFIRDVRSLDAAAGGRTPAIALTAFARAEDRLRAMLAGYQVHLAKPINPQELASVVRALYQDLGAAAD